jgi:hypothetical protein
LTDIGAPVMVVAAAEQRKTAVAPKLEAAQIFGR